MDIEDAVVVDGHAKPEPSVDLGLDLDVDQDAAFAAVLSNHSDQGVRQAPTRAGLARQMPQLGIQEPVPPAPVDVGMDRREVEFQEGGELLMQRM